MAAPSASLRMFVTAHRRGIARFAAEGRAFCEGWARPRQPARGLATRRRRRQRAAASIRAKSPIWGRVPTSERQGRAATSHQDMVDAGTDDDAQSAQNRDAMAALAAMSGVGQSAEEFRGLPTATAPGGHSGGLSKMEWVVDADALAPSASLAEQLGAAPLVRFRDATVPTRWLWVKDLDAAVLAPEAWVTALSNPASLEEAEREAGAEGGGDAAAKVEPQSLLSRSATRLTVAPHAPPCPVALTVGVLDAPFAVAASTGQAQSPAQLAHLLVGVHMRKTGPVGIQRDDFALAMRGWMGGGDDWDASTLANRVASAVGGPSGEGGAGAGGGLRPRVHDAWHAEVPGRAGVEVFGVDYETPHSDYTAEQLARALGGARPGASGGFRYCVTVVTDSGRDTAAEVVWAAPASSWSQLWDDVGATLFDSVVLQAGGANPSN